jgi:glycosyltransferase involved in cell wall biosynthesis
VLITVAICTLNRAESLRRTLASVAAMRVPDGLEWEVVVVNNGSTDHTDDVIRSFADRLPVRREFQPQRGISRARNSAVDAAKGDFIVWTDDDVLVDPGWLAAYVEAFLRWPEAAVFGGPIIPRYESPVPKWISQCDELLVGPYATRDFGNDVLLLSNSDGRVPFGSSYALRIAEQRAFRYNPKMGQAPGQRRTADESDVIERVLLSGANGYWLPKARVEHCIGRERQTVGYVARWFQNLGETDAFRYPARYKAPQWFGVPRWLWWQLIAEWALYRVHRLISPAPVWMTHLKNTNTAWGGIRYWRSQKGLAASWTSGARDRATRNGGNP